MTRPLREARSAAFAGSYIVKRCLACLSLCAVLQGLPAGPAAADEYDPVNVLLGGSVVHDANVFRLPGFVDPQLVVGKSTKSDLIGVLYAGLLIDQPYRQQRFQLSLTESRYRYQNFSFLDFDALNYRGVWLWHLSPRVSGTLSAEHKEALVPFADFRVFQRNVRATDNRVFNLDAWVFGGWHLLLGASQYEQKNEQPFLAEADYRLAGIDAGIRYVARSGNSASLIRRAREGDYLNRIIDPATLFDNAFRQDDTELRAIWAVTGKSALNGRLTWLERRHENFPQRDFSGTAGELAYVWTPTGKLRLDFSARRDIRAWWEPFASYRVDDTLAFTPAWAVTAKTAVRARLERTTSDFRGPVFTPLGPLRSDTVRSAQLSADWAPLRSVSLSASVQRLDRSSNNAGVEFTTTIATVSASLKF